MKKMFFIYLILLFTLFIYIPITLAYTDSIVTGVDNNKTNNLGTNVTILGQGVGGGLLYNSTIIFTSVLGQSMVIGNNKLMMASTTNFTVWNLSSNKVLCSFQVLIDTYGPGGYFDTSNGIYITSLGSSVSFQAINVTTCTQYWLNNDPSTANPTFIVGSNIYNKYYLTDKAALYEVNKVNGKTNWSIAGIATGGNAIGGLSTDGYRIFVIDPGASRLFAFNASAVSGQIWNWTSTVPILGQAVLDESRETVYIRTNTNSIFALNKTTGGVLWNNTVGANFIGPIALVDDLLIFNQGQTNLTAYNITSQSKKWTVTGSVGL